MSTHDDNFSCHKISLYEAFTVHHEFRSNKPGPHLKIYLKKTFFKTKVGNSDKLVITSLNLFKQIPE
jgi:hypothetical protein